MMNDLLLVVDSGVNAVLILRDLSAAFDLVNHNLLLSHLEHWVGIKDKALLWFESYLKSRTFSVAIGHFFPHHLFLSPVGFLKGQFWAHYSLI